MGGLGVVKLVEYHDDGSMTRRLLNAPNASQSIPAVETNESLQPAEYLEPQPPTAGFLLYGSAVFLLGLVLYGLIRRFRSKGLPKERNEDDIRESDVILGHTAP